MTSKTFKNAHTVHGYMTVREENGCVSVSVNMDSPSDTIIHIAPSDAPAVMLAIGEAAGVVPFNPEGVPYDFQDRTDDMEPVNMAVFMLTKHIETQAKRAAAEADRVKLEQEALALFNAYRARDGKRPRESFESLNATRELWLAVARAARELNKEAGNA